MNAKERNLTVPTIHLNGTSREALTEGYLDAWRAASEAMNKLAGSCPNARDYYPAGPAALRLAVHQHVDRVRKLESIILDLYALAEACQEAP